MRINPVARVPALIAIAIAATSCGGDETNGATPGAAAAAVKIVDTAFQPAEIRISSGETVKWTWEGSLQHSVTADDKSFDSKIGTKGKTFEQTFTKPGRVEYYCQVHSKPDGDTQNGVVVVE